MSLGMGYCCTTITPKVPPKNVCCSEVGFVHAIVTTFIELTYPQTIKKLFPEFGFETKTKSPTAAPVTVRVSP